MYLLIFVQLFILPIPNMLWKYGKGSIIEGHIKHLMFMLLGLQDLVKSIPKVRLSSFKEIDYYDNTGESLRTWGDYDSKDVVDNRSRLRDHHTELNDRTFLNMLAFQNMSNMEIYPFLRSMMKHYSRNFVRNLHTLKPSDIHPIKIIILMWEHQNNLPTQFLVSAYKFKHAFTFFVTSFYILMYMIAALTVSSHTGAIHIPTFDPGYNTFFCDVSSWVHANSGFHICNFYRSLFRTYLNIFVKIYG